MNNTCLPHDLLMNYLDNRTELTPDDLLALLNRELRWWELLLTAMAGRTSSHSPDVQLLIDDTVAASLTMRLRVTRN
jgi:hypothetical protein